jgi:hypothetical protein
MAYTSFMRMVRILEVMVAAAAAAATSQIFLRQFPDNLE